MIELFQFLILAALLWAIPLDAAAQDRKQLKCGESDATTVVLKAGKRAKGWCVRSIKDEEAGEAYATEQCLSILLRGIEGAPIDKDGFDTFSCADAREECAASGLACWGYNKNDLSRSMSKIKVDCRSVPSDIDSDAPVYLSITCTCEVKRDIALSFVWGCVACEEGATPPLFP